MVIVIIILAVILISVYSVKKANSENKTNSVSSTPKINTIARNTCPEDLSLHEDIENLVFCSDCTPTHKMKFEYIRQDPSFINKTLPIITYRPDHSVVEKLDYFPSYIMMKPAQRGKYLKFLENPYDNSYEIGYVFTLFYGLEHHLICGDKTKAIEVISKLRKCHDNESFQKYSFDALAYYYDCSGRFVEFLTESYEELNLNYSIYYHLITDLLYPGEMVIKFKKQFGLKKDAYINRNPANFLYELNNQFTNEYGVPCVALESYPALRNMDKPYFLFPANVTLRTKLFPYDIPKNTHIESAYVAVSEDLSRILSTTYDIVADSKKNINTETSDDSLSEFHREKVVDAHYTYLEKYQELYTTVNQSKDYYSADADEFIYLCNEDIQIAAEFAETCRLYDQPIPYYPAFHKLSMFYEKRGEFNQAIAICDTAIELGYENDETKGGMSARKARLEKKLFKEV